MVWSRPTSPQIYASDGIGHQLTDCAEIISFCDELLDPGGFDDYGPNGLQVPGAREITKVATGVSAHRELIDRAVTAGAQLLIVHHGLFWDFHPRSLTVQMATRLRMALGADLAIAGYHLPLDAHPQIGNNALIRDGLGYASSPEPFGLARGRAIGVVGRSDEGVPVDELRGRIESLTGRAPLAQGAGPAVIHSIGVVSGAGSSSIHEAVALGLDALITGEPAEHAMADATEGDIHFFAAGHYATETFGIKRLGELLAENLGVEHEFIDVPNPV